MRTRPRAGFSLIEALVALAIAAMTLTAIFELQIQMVRGQRRAEQALENVQIQENAIALVRDVNPMQTPNGVFRLPNGLTYRYEATPKGAQIRNAGFPNGNGRYTLQMFHVTVMIERPSGGAIPSIAFDRVGWTSVGDL